MDNKNYQQQQETIQQPLEHVQTSAKTSAKLPKVKHKRQKTIIDGRYEQLLSSFFKSQFKEQSIYKKETDEKQISFVKQFIAPLNNQHTLNYLKIFQDTVISNFKKYQKKPDQSLKNMNQSIQTFIFIVKIYRQCSVNSPIIVATTQSFFNLWTQLLLEGRKQGHNLEQNFKQKVIELWKYIPHSNLQQFLNKFDLIAKFSKINLEQFLKFLTISFFEGKIQQTCLYYTIYKNSIKVNQQQKVILDKFQLQQIVPKITKKDQIFSQYVIKLLKMDSDIAEKVYQTVSIKEEERLVELVGDDVNKHKRVIKNAMKKNYIDTVLRNKQWYTIQDKLSYSKTFIRWYAQKLLKKSKSSKSSQAQNSQNQGGNELVSKYQFENSYHIGQSLLHRIQQSQSPEIIIENPLYKYDSFMPFELMVQQLNLSNTDFNHEDFVKIDQKSVFFIHQVDQEFNKACEALFKSQIIGFDTQFVPVQTKFQQSGVSIIQISSLTQTYIFDYHSMRKFPQFIDFFIKLMQNENIVKVGHTISSDMQYLYKNFANKMGIRNFIDLTHLFKKRYPRQIYSSLAYMTTKILKKRLCKYQQRGNWLRRPLKKTQLYYAALDARICVMIYNKISSQFDEDPQFLQKQMENLKLEQKSSKKQNVWYEYNPTGFEQYNKNPIFLIDNMLKKLCSTLRNYGLDAEFIAVKDNQLTVSQSIKEKRIVITRDTKLALNKHSLAPIYLLRQKSDTFVMFKQLIDFFKLDLNKFEPLSRCVKCNGPELIVISSQQAKQQINFLYEQNKIMEYFRCTKCRQIYWQGGQFQKAMKKFTNKIDNQ